MRGLKRNYLVWIAFIGLMSVQLQAGYKDTIPPEILKQYDPAIINGSRPTYESITQADIFGLRKNPHFKADYVLLKFDPNKLSAIQKKIFFQWLEGGYAKILLQGKDVNTYGAFLGQTVSRSGHNTSSPPYLKKVRGAKVDLFVDTQKVNVTSGHYRSNYYYCYSLANPVDKVVTLARFNFDNKNSAIGIFKACNTLVYFYGCGGFSGSDADRFLLNYKSWLLGLPIPGAANPTIAPATLKDQKGLDCVTLTNGNTVRGTLKSKINKINAFTKELDVKASELRKIVLNHNRQKEDSFIFRNGDKIKGSFMSEKLAIKIKSGQTILIPKKDILEVDFAQ